MKIRHHHHHQQQQQEQQTKKSRSGTEEGIINSHYQYEYSKTKRTKTTKTNRTRTSRTRSKGRVVSTTTNRCIILISFIVLFCINYWFLTTYFPLSKKEQQQVDNTHILEYQKQQQKSSSSSSLPSTIDNIDYDEKYIQTFLNPKEYLQCYDHGCHIYPPELTIELHQLLTETYITKSRRRQQQVFDNNNDTNNNYNITKKMTTKTIAFPFANDKMAMLTQRGKSHVYNQDRGVVVQPFHTLVTATNNNDKNSNNNHRSSSTSSSSGNDNDDDDTFLVGIFDGHGREGHIVAAHIAVDLPERLANKLNEMVRNTTTTTTTTTTRTAKMKRPSSSSPLLNDEQIVQALKETFIEVDTHAPPSFLLGGSTSTVTLRIGSKLYVANAGDSQTIIVSVPSTTTGYPTTLNEKQKVIEQSKVIFMTRKDKASLADEYQRITNLGGKVNINNQTHDSRVIVKSNAARDIIGLAMSRSIGDWEWKPVGVIAEPIVNIIDLKNEKQDQERMTKGISSSSSSSQLFLIAGSDGIWDVRRREFYAKKFARSFFLPVDTTTMKKQNRNDTNTNDDDDENKNIQPMMDPLQNCWEVIQEVTPKSKQGYRDDQTVIVMRL